jgi:general secretion pathway protein G
MVTTSPQPSPPQAAEREQKQTVVTNVTASRRQSLCGFLLGPRPSTLGPEALRAFTLIELLVVMAIIALLLTIAVPRYFHSTDRAKEAVLKEDLAQMRDAIDKYYGDRGRYPDSLDDLVEKKYLRRIPADPITESVQTWVSVLPEETGKGEVSDVKSGAPGTALDGTSYGDW